MTLKVVNASTALTNVDLWQTAGTTSVHPLYHNQIQWIAQTVYRYIVDVHPGQITITVKVEGGAVLDTFTVHDSTFGSGRFGFYEYSQGPAQYFGLQNQKLQPLDYRYDADATDADGDTLVYSLPTAPPGMTINSSTGVIAWPASAAPVGSYPVSVRATDPGGLFDTQSYMLQVSSTNQAPTVLAGADQVVTLPDTAALTGIVDDDALPAGSTVACTWSKPSGPGTVTFASASSVITSATFSTSGAYVLRLSCTDGTLSASDDVSITVNPFTPNAPPTVACGPDREMRLPQHTVTISCVVMDDGRPRALTTSWNVSGTVQGNPFPQIQTDFGFSSASARFESLPGVYHFTLTANDGALTASDEVMVTVLPAVDNPPTVATAATASPNPTTLQTNLSVLGADERGEALLTYTWAASGPAPVRFSENGTNAARNCVATFRRAGSYVLSVTITDAAAQTVVSTTNVTVDPVLSYLAALPTPAATTTVQPLAVSAFAFDQFVALLSPPPPFAWTRPSGPGTATFSTPNASSTNVSFDSAGSHVVAVTSSALTANLAVTVSAVNQPPVANAGADQTVEVPGPVTLVGSATDDGLPVGMAPTYHWDQTAGPGGALIITPDAATTKVTFTSTGTYVFRLRVSDSLESGLDEVTVNVQPGNMAPVVNAGADQTITLPARTATLSGTVSDDGKPAGAVVTSRWELASGPGSIVFGNPLSLATTATFDAVGTYVLRLTAQDTKLQGSDAVTVTVAGTPPVGDPPTVAITSPGDLSTVTGPIDVRGTVTSGTLLGWRLEYRDKSMGDGWTTIASGDAPVTDGVLGKFDPTLLLNGIYQLRLVAADTSGRQAQTPEDEPALNVRGRLKVGQFTLSYLDLSVSLAGIPIQLLRNYDSRDTRKGDFGFGWTLDVSGVRVSESGKIGRNWTVVPHAGFFTTYCVEPRKGSRVSITLPEGRVFEFEATVEDGCETFLRPSLVTVGFRPLPGTTASLVPADGGSVLVQDDQLLDLNSTVYDPSTYVLTLKDGRSLVVADRTAPRGAGLKSIIDLNGNSVSFDSGAFAHSTGIALGIARDEQNRIVSITDPAGGQLSYRYDPDGDLASVTDRTGARTEFRYDTSRPHRLVEVIGPRGVPAIRADYDDDGRLIATTDASGKAITYAHHIDDRRDIVVNRLGDQKLFEYDERGNVIREVDEEGGEVRQTFDAHDNLTSKTSANGLTWGWEYDSDDNLVRSTDPLGKATVFTVDAYGRVVSSTDPLGHTTQLAYDAGGNLTSLTDPAGRTTTYSYDGHGNQTAWTDPLGHSTRWAYDFRGFTIRRTDALGNVTSYAVDDNGLRKSQTTTRTVSSGTETLVTAYEYDAEGRLIKVTSPDGSETRTSYDPDGREVARIDGLGRTTTSVYDDVGRRTAVVAPGGTTNRVTYDAEGRPATTTDTAGRVTTYQYDRLGRLARTTLPDGASSVNGYDAGGRLTSVTDARGAATTYEYDGDDRLIRMTDPLGNSTRYDFDAAGNLVGLHDPSGAVTTYFHDESNRVVGISFADGTHTSVGYDLAGRRTLATDQLGRATQFAYDAAGRLVQITDPLGHIIRYGYDENGRRISQVDANGQETRFEFDKVDRQTKRIFPDGKAEAVEYDVEGNVRAYTDFMGRRTTLVYDEEDRLIGKHFPDGHEVSFSYTATGERGSSTDARGTTTFVYDTRDRVVATTYPDGRRLEFAYDPEGNQTASTVKIGSASFTTTHAYDLNGRTTSVADPAGHLTTYVYDGRGARTRQVQPNGTETRYTFDAVGRLVDSTTVDTGSSAVLASFHYALGPTGTRTRLEEVDGTVRSYEYDGADRLVTETVTGASGYQKVFSYDAASNRLSQVTTGAGAGNVSYTYDSRDRLLAENGLVHTWNDNGEQVSTSAGAAYRWDFEGRLVEVTRPDGTVVDHTYDVDGNRVATTVTPAGGSPATTLFLVDTTGRASQVVAESDETSAVKAVYVRADDQLAAVVRGGTIRYYVNDGLGSVRELRDTAGAVTDRYSYSAAGELLGHVGSDPQPYGFAGEAFDRDTQLSYLRARWMDPRVGRFISSDPAKGCPWSPMCLHRYLYAAANPVNLTDPNGLQFGVSEVALISYSTMGLSGKSLGGPGSPGGPLRVSRRIGHATVFNCDNRQTNLLEPELDQMQSTDVPNLRAGYAFDYHSGSNGKGPARLFRFSKRISPNQPTEWECQDWVTSPIMSTPPRTVHSKIYAPFWDMGLLGQQIGVTHEYVHQALARWPDAQSVASVVVTNPPFPANPSLIPDKLTELAGWVANHIVSVIGLTPDNVGTNQQMYINLQAAIRRR
jgi:RHS repeat-associated protein